jgi:Mn2+/Fe2+ NRAMP family transporter
MGAYFIRGSFAAGQSSTITGTLAGQIIMEGYLNLNSALRRITMTDCHCSGGHR